MSTVALNIRGTNGTGKTTLARHVLRLTGARPHKQVGKKIRSYKGAFRDVELYVLGSYEANCGGCDTIQPFDEIPALIKEYMSHPHPTILVYEGLLISHSIGRIGELVKQYGRRHIMAFLDTPLEVCLQRVDARRAERGVGPLLDNTNIVKDYKAVQRARERAIQMGFHVADINHAAPFNQVEALLESLHQLALAPEMDNGTGDGPPRVRARTPEALD